MSKYVAVADNVLVKLDRNDCQKTAGGIWAPPERRDTVDGVVGTVLASGPGVPYVRRAKPGRRTIPSDASPHVGDGFVPNETRPGDRVLLDSAKAGDVLPAEMVAAFGLDTDADYRIVREAEIVAVLDAAR